MLAEIKIKPNKNIITPKELELVSDITKDKN